VYVHPTPYAFHPINLLFIESCNTATTMVNSLYRPPSAHTQPYTSQWVAMDFFGLSRALWSFGRLSYPHWLNPVIRQPIATKTPCCDHQKARCVDAIIGAYLDSMYPVLHRIALDGCTALTRLDTQPLEEKHGFVQVSSVTCCSPPIDYGRLTFYFLTSLPFREGGAWL